MYQIVHSLHLFIIHFSFNELYLYSKLQCICKDECNACSVDQGNQNAVHHNVFNCSNFADECLVLLYLNIAHL